MKVRIAFTVDIPDNELYWIKADVPCSPFLGKGTVKQRLSKIAERLFDEFLVREIDDLTSPDQEWRKRAPSGPVRKDI